MICHMLGFLLLINPCLRSGGCLGSSSDSLESVLVAVFTNLILCWSGRDDPMGGQFGVSPGVS